MEDKLPFTTVTETVKVCYFFMFYMMLLNIWQLNEALITYFELLRFLSCVSTFMLLAMFWLLKTFITVLAFIWSYPWVYMFMSLAIWQPINHSSQYLHWCGLSLVCVLSCHLHVDDRRKLLLQYLHVLRLTPVWVSSCSLYCNTSIRAVARLQNKTRQFSSAEGASR